LASVQTILVCAQDSVLAKKVRYLLARDECEVEILSKPSQLERRLRDSPVALLILSRSLDGEDAVEILARLDPTLSIPATIVLGGAPTITADFITVIPDPIDTQAIYRIASDVLSSLQQTLAGEIRGEIGDEEMTHLNLGGPPTKRRSTPNPGAGGSPSHPIEESTTDRSVEDEINFSEITGLDGHGEAMQDAFENNEPNRTGQTPMSPGQRNRPQAASSKQPPDPPVLGGLLEPARFAKVIYQCWSKQTTGALIVARDHETLTIHFENGSPVHVESSIPGDQLGRSLVNRGRITEAQYADGAKRAIERGLKLGQALVELAFFTNQELGRELGTNAREQIVACFAARQGAFEFDPKRKVPTDERPYSISVGQILADGIKRHGDEQILREIIGDIDTKYFKLYRTVEELSKRFPLEPKETAFLEFSGRAYNVADAAEVSGLDLLASHKLLALLITSEEVQDFTPGVKEFEARINEERQRSRDIEKLRSVPPTVEEKAPIFLDKRPGVRTGFPPPPAPPMEEVIPPGLRKIPSSIVYEPPAPPPLPTTSSPFGPQGSAVPPTVVTSGPQPHPSNGDAAVPPMPVPANSEGTVPRPLVYAKPLPRSADGTPLETQERTLSREHFQRGVTLLGQGNFASAEEAFRDAVALCSEEHVYLIGLARAIYYNPGYRADGKVPVLKAIVGRAGQLAPDDNRVATLSTWIQTAESQLAR
jgi:hypothetical protein